MNRRPSACKADALPTELQPHFYRRLLCCHPQMGINDTFVSTRENLIYNIFWIVEGLIRRKKRIHWVSSVFSRSAFPDLAFPGLSFLDLAFPDLWFGILRRILVLARRCWLSLPSKMFSAHAWIRTMDLVVISDAL